MFKVYIIGCRYRSFGFYKEFKTEKRAVAVAQEQVARFGAKAAKVLGPNGYIAQF